MKKIIVYCISAGISLCCGNLIANESVEVKWQADVSSSVQFLAHSRSNIGNLGIGVQDAIMRTEIKDSKSSPLKIMLGIGVLEYISYEGTIAPFSPIDIGLHYGWLEYQLSPRWQWQMGQLENQAGFENGVSTKNSHIQFGGINHSRSFYYPGTRALYSSGAVQFYAEISGPEIPNDTGTGLGVKYDYGSGMLAGNVTQYLDEESVYYNFNWEQRVSRLTLGGVLDYIQLNKAPAWRDDQALALAGYLKLQFRKRYLALRGEYFDAGNSGVYGYEEAGVITLTYGYDITPTAFMRFEGMYAKSSNNIFQDSKVPVNDQYGIAMQIGVRFGKRHSL
ncbi:MAG: porin [Gammaproteobacteria bacterium]|nr:porin [Gammaproteobacteria bacterium]